jgi:predicted dehydrogenase
MKTYNLGIVGYGGFGHFLHHWWDQLDELTISAVSDLNKPASLATQVNFFSDWKDLIRQADIDIVSIATPPVYHCEMACQVMESGKHVIIEKPLALSLPDAERILNTQRRTGMKAIVNHMLRYHPVIEGLLKLSEDRLFGSLRHVMLANYAQDSSLDADHWFWDPEMSGGIFVEHGVHFIDLTNAFAGRGDCGVYGCAHARDTGQQDQVCAMFDYGGGLIAQHYHSFSRPGFFEKTKLSFAFDLADIDLLGWIPLEGTLRSLLKDENLPDLNTLPGWKVLSQTPIHRVSDISRPGKWGRTGRGLSGIVSGGRSYEVDQLVEGTFSMNMPKSDVYGLCLQNIILDLIRWIEDDNHTCKVTLEDACRSLQLALEATQNSTS